MVLRLFIFNEMCVCKYVCSDTDRDTGQNTNPSCRQRGYPKAKMTAVVDTLISKEC